MRQPPARTSPAPAAPQPAAAKPRHARRQTATRPACGHARYTKGCNMCAFAGHYQEHINWPGITPAERSEVTRLYRRRQGRTVRTVADLATRGQLTDKPTGQARRLALVRAWHGRQRWHQNLEPPGGSPVRIDWSLTRSSRCAAASA